MATNNQRRPSKSKSRYPQQLGEWRLIKGEVKVVKAAQGPGARQILAVDNPKRTSLYGCLFFGLCPPYSFSVEKGTP
jgi:hypothetical protein